MLLHFQTDFSGDYSFLSHFFGGNFGELERGGSLS